MSEFDLMRGVSPVPKFFKTHDGYIINIDDISHIVYSEDDSELYFRSGEHSSLSIDEKTYKSLCAILFPPIVSMGSGVEIHEVGTVPDKSEKISLENFFNEIMKK